MAHRCELSCADSATPSTAVVLLSAPLPRGGHQQAGPYVGDPGGFSRPVTRLKSTAKSRSGLPFFEDEEHAAIVAES